MRDERDALQAACAERIGGPVPSTTAMLQARLPGGRSAAWLEAMAAQSTTATQSEVLREKVRSVD